MGTKTVKQCMYMTTSGLHELSNELSQISVTLSFSSLAWEIIRQITSFVNRHHTGSACKHAGRL